MTRRTLFHRRTVAAVAVAAVFAAVIFAAVASGVLANFTRVETFGARNTHWVSATVDPNDPNLFAFEPRIVAANAG